MSHPKEQLFMEFQKLAPDRWWPASSDAPMLSYQTDIKYVLRFPLSTAEDGKSAAEAAKAAFGNFRICLAKETANLTQAQRAQVKWRSSLGEIRIVRDDDSEDVQPTIELQLAKPLLSDNDGIV